MVLESATGATPPRYWRRRYVTEAMERAIEFAALTPEERARREAEIEWESGRRQEEMAARIAALDLKTETDLKALFGLLGRRLRALRALLTWIAARRAEGELSVLALDLPVRVSQPSSKRRRALARAARGCELLSSRDVRVEPDAFAPLRQTAREVGGTLDMLMPVVLRVFLYVASGYFTGTVDESQKALLSKHRARRESLDVEPPQPVPPPRARGPLKPKEEVAKVLALAARGLSAQSIASRTGIPKRTVCRWLQWQREDRLAPPRSKARKAQAERRTSRR